MAATLISQAIVCAYAIMCIKVTCLSASLTRRDMSENSVPRLHVAVDQLGLQPQLLYTSDTGICRANATVEWELLLEWSRTWKTSNRPNGWEAGNGFIFFVLVLVFWHQHQHKHGCHSDGVSPMRCMPHSCSWGATCLAA